MPVPTIKRMPDVIPAPAQPIKPFLSNNRKNIQKTDKVLCTRTVESLKGLQPLHFLPSFLLRTLNDSLHVEPAKLTRLQRRTLSDWRRAGLGRKQAIEQIDKFYRLGLPGLNAIDKSYLTAKRSDLDAKFVKDLEDADFSGFYESMPLSPVRIADALATGVDHSLTPAEQDLIKAIAHADSFPLRRDKLLTLPLARHWARPEDIKWAAPEPEPPTYYKMLAHLLNYRINVSSDGISGLADPRFLIYSFYNPEPTYNPAARPWCQKVTYNSLGDNVEEGYWKTYANLCETVAALVEESYYGWAYEEFYADACDLAVFNPARHIETGSAPIIVVKAFEDDTMFSEDTRASAEFTLQWASTLTAFDPTGILSFVVGLVNLAFKLLCWIDDIDQDDRLGTEVWEIDESAIPDKDRSTMSHIFHFKEKGGDNDWQLEMQAIFWDPVTT